MSEKETVVKTKLCIHCGEDVFGYGERVPLFPKDVQWGVHLKSDKFSCQDDNGNFLKDENGRLLFATVEL